MHWKFHGGYPWYSRCIVPLCFYNGLGNLCSVLLQSYREAAQMNFQVEKLMIFKFVDPVTEPRNTMSAMSWASKLLKWTLIFSALQNRPESKSTKYPNIKLPDGFCEVSILMISTLNSTLEFPFYRVCHQGSKIYFYEAALCKLWLTDNYRDACV